MVTLVILADRMIPTEEIQKVSSRYLDWFRFYEFFFVKNPTNCPIIECVPYIIILKIIARFKFQSCLCLAVFFSCPVIIIMLLGYQPNYGTVSGIFYKEKFIKTKPIEIS